MSSTKHYFGSYISAAEGHRKDKTKPQDYQIGKDKVVVLFFSELGHVFLCSKSNMSTLCGITRA